MESVAYLAYGDGRVPLELDPKVAEWHVIAPRDEPALADPRRGFIDACRNPVGCAPLRDTVKPGDRVVIVTSDGTRPVPNRVLIPWLLEELPVPPDQVTVLLGNGTHRANTRDEIVAMFGEDVVRRIKVVNHDAFDDSCNERVGHTLSGAPVLLDSVYVKADKRIVAGFIEPHFFAGFSGGAKGVAPGVAALDTIFHLHTYKLIADPNSTWGVVDDNPIQALVTEMVGLCPPDFLINVTLNADKAITAFFAGDCHAAHRAGCAHVRAQAMVPIPHTFPIVVTSNSGYPLDQNLYQSVKGMSAAAQIVAPGGTVIMASECRDGIPSHGNFRGLMQRGAAVADVDAWLRGLSSPVLDQWQAQVLVRVRERCDVGLYSTLDAASVEACKLSPVDDFQRRVYDHVAAIGPDLPVAVLPEGPLTFPSRE